MEKLDKVLNENYKNKNWFSKNYFWAGTVLVVFVCTLLFLVGGNSWNPFNHSTHPYLYGVIYSFGHGNLQHLLLNMLCFLVAGLYLERKTGTIKLILLILAFSFISIGITSAISGFTNWIGYSGVNFALYFYIIVDYLFLLFQKEKRIKISIILGAIVVALIYLAMCFTGGTTGFAFAWYPWDLINNDAHIGGAITGTIVGLLLNTAQFGRKRDGSATPTQINDKPGENSKQ